MMPPMSSCASTRWTRRMPRLPRTIAHSMPAGPALTTSTSLSAFLARVKRSGCQPRRYSSPAVAFWVQMTGGPPISQREMQMLQPMHSRMSSSRPSSIFLGSHGSEMDGRQVAMMSSLPDLTASTIRSGLVKRPTPRTGFFATFFTASCQQKEGEQRADVAQDVAEVAGSQDVNGAAERPHDDDLHDQVERHPYIRHAASIEMAEPRDRHAVLRHLPQGA